MENYNLHGKDLRKYLGVVFSVMVPTRHFGALVILFTVYSLMDRHSLFLALDMYIPSVGWKMADQPMDLK